MNEIKIYISTCDKNLHILPATIYLHKKFINIDIKLKFVILGFSKPELPDWENVEFIKLSDKPQNLDMWSKYYFDYFNNINEEMFFFVLDDFFPLDYINDKSFEFVINYMKNNKDVGFCTLGKQPNSKNELESVIIESEDIYVYKRRKNIPYQITLQPAIWNRSYFLKMFSYTCSPWQFELNITGIANEDKNFYNIGTSKNNKFNKCVLSYLSCSSLSSRWKGINVLGLNHKYILELIDKKILDERDLFIGGVDINIKFDKNNELSGSNFVKFCKQVSGFDEWIDLYENYYT
jgi:hypothetical protein